MAHFLSAGFIREDLEEVEVELQAVKELLLSISLEDDSVTQAWYHLKKALEDIERVREFIDRFPAEPLIYTGNENTQQIISKLEKLLTNEKYAS